MQSVILGPKCQRSHTVAILIVEVGNGSTTIDSLLVRCTLMLTHAVNWRLPCHECVTLELQFNAEGVCISSNHEQLTYTSLLSSGSNDVFSLPPCCRTYSYNSHSLPEAARSTCLEVIAVSQSNLYYDIERQHSVIYMIETAYRQKSIQS